MKNLLLYRFILLVLAVSSSIVSATGQKVFFIDGYHGGVYGHYPEQYTAFLNEMLAKHPQWNINLEIEPETWDTVAIHEPANYRRFQQWMADQSDSGRIEYVNPAYGQPYLYNINGESIIRNFEYGIRKLRTHFPGLLFTTYSSEEPCFTSALPQILRSFGFEYASLKNPNTCWGGYTRNYGGELIHWQGPDGTHIPTVPRYAVEALDKKSTWQTEASTNRPSYLKAAFQSGIAHPVGMCLQDAGWKNGPWLGEGKQPYPTQYTTWRNYFHNVIKNVNPLSWRLSQEDVQVSLVWGAQVLQQIAKQNRFAENKIVRAEKLAALSSVFGNAAYPSSDFDEAWRNIMLSQHHDCWIVPYNGHKNDTWIDKVQRWTDSANNISSRSVAVSFASLRERQTSLNNISSVPLRERNINPIHYANIFNPTANNLNTYVRIPLPANLQTSPVTVQDRHGNHILSQTDRSKKELIIKAVIPATGIKTFKLTSNSAVQPAASMVSSSGSIYTIETDVYRITIDASKGGAITSLIAKQMNNKEFVNLQKGAGLNELKGYFFRDSAYFSSTANPASINVVNDGPLTATIDINGHIQHHPFTQSLTVYKGDPLIDMSVKIDWQGNPGIGDDYKQGGGYQSEDYRKAFYDDRKKLRTLFPLNFEIGKVYKNAPFDVTESRLENTYFTSWDSIKNNVMLNWVDLTDAKGDYGVALFTDHTTAYSHATTEPLGLITQYSGVGLWGRNYSLNGATEIRYALVPHRGDWKKADVWSINVNWNNPPEVEINSGEIQRDQFIDASVFSIKQKGFEITAMQKKGNDVLIRIFNPHPSPRNADLVFTIPFTEVEEQHLDGRFIQRIKARNTRSGKHISVPLKAFGLTTLIVKNLKKE